MGSEERDGVRNFRSAYYEKVGCRSVEEKKTLERLLKERPLDFENLREFTRRFSLPSLYREAVWMLLLDISSSVDEVDQFVSQEQRALSNNLTRALHYMNLLQGETTVNKKLAMMYLLESGKLAFDVEKQFSSKSTEVSTILAITSAFETMKCSTPFVNDYWLMRQFLFKLDSLLPLIPEMLSKCSKCMSQQEPQLHTQLTKTGAIGYCLNIWFERCFAGILHENTLIRVWDRVIGGSYQKTLPLIAILILTNNKQHILSSTLGNKVSDIRAVLMKPIPKDASELIFTQMVERDTKLR